MLIYPAIDLFNKKAVRLYKGDYNKMTIYSDNPLSVANDFKASGAECIHLVDLEGAKSGNNPNFDEIIKIKKETGLFCEVGGGIRSTVTVKKYLDAGIDRVILGTAAVNDERLVETAVKTYPGKIAVGIDVKDGVVLIKGWTERSAYKTAEFLNKMKNFGVNTFICTDISKDGVMNGTNFALYDELNKISGVNIIASGGVSTLTDVKKLSEMNLYGAIIGKAYYTGAINIKDAVEVSK